MPFMIDSTTPGTVSLPPMGVDCGSAQKWRNSNRCAVDSAVESLQKSSMGTELDWMTFLFDVARQIGLNELMAIHRAACQPGDGMNGFTKNCRFPIGVENGVIKYDVANDGLPIAWLDGPLGGTIQPDGSVAGAREHGGILSGARRKYGLVDPRTLSILDRGNVHGVSEDTAPLDP